MTTLQNATPPYTAIPAGEVYFTRAEAAAHCRLGVSTLAKLAMEGTGPISCRIGRSVRYRRSDLDAWMAARVAA